MTISKDRVKPSPVPDSWKLSEIFATGVVIGTYLAMMTLIFFWAMYETDFFPVLDPFLVSSIERQSIYMVKKQFCIPVTKLEVLLRGKRKCLALSPSPFGRLILV